MVRFDHSFLWYAAVDADSCQSEFIEQENGSSMPQTVRECRTARRYEPDPIMIGQGSRDQRPLASLPSHPATCCPSAKA